MIQEYAEVGRSQEDLGRSNIFEIHIAKFALYDYKNRTNNFVGAEFVSGRGQGLLPSKVAEKAANFTNSVRKLEKSLGAKKGPGGGGKGDHKGGKGAAGPCYH